jgi:hypothetical protein
LDSLAWKATLSKQRPQEIDEHLPTNMPFAPRLPDIRNSAQHQFFLIAVKQIYKSIYDEVMECSHKDCPVHNIVVFKPAPIDKSNPEGLIDLLNVKYGKGSAKLLQKEGANDTFNYFSSSFV